MSTSDERQQATTMLSAISAGDSNKMDALFHLVYDQLRKIAAHQMIQERSQHTLSPTALVHEAYVKLIEGQVGGVDGRAQFLALAAMAMRRILVDHARAKGREKRGAGRLGLELKEHFATALQEKSLEILGLEEALRRLSEKNSRRAKVLELRLFAAMEMEEIARVVGCSVRTAANDWAIGRAWIRRELSHDEDE